MNDLQLKCFLAAAEYENFTKASERLYLSQSVLGRHISNLEGELDFSLFHRERKTVKLTDNGHIFLQFLLECVDKYNSTIARIQANLRSANMSLILGTAEGQQIGDCYSEAFRHLVNHAPNLHVTIAYFLNLGLMDALKMGTIDAAITSLDDILPFTDIYEYKKLKIVHTGLVVPINHPSTMKKTLEITDFQDEQFILLSEIDSALATQRQIETMRIIGTSRYITAPDISTLSVWAEAGLGITTIPENHKLSSHPDLIFLKFPELHPATEVLAWRKSNNNPAIPIFCDIWDKTGYHMSD